MNLSRNEKIAWLKANKADQLALKKATVKHCDAAIVPFVDKHNGLTTKMLERNLPLDTDEVIYRTLIANTYNYMDSHDDVHLNNLFKKSIQETKKIFLLHDHKFEVGAQIGRIMKAYEQDGRFIYFGYNSSKDTQALLLDVAIEKAKNESVFNQYKNEEIDQHSVGMQYVQVDLALDDKADPNAYALYQRTLPLIGNSEDVEKQGYFFAVSEAKLRETSSVLMGSNPITGVFDNNKSIVSIDELKKMFDEFANKEDIYNLCKDYTDTFKKPEPLPNTQIDKKPSIYTMIK
jgi:hypothetical protein